ncbi:PR domain zinc finger protein 2 [Aulostomus maculatus]
MDAILKASSLLLMTLLLTVQLSSSAPIPAEFFQPSAVAEENSQAEVLLEKGGQGTFIVEGHDLEEPVQKELIPVVAAESDIFIEEQADPVKLPSLEAPPNGITAEVSPAVAAESESSKQPDPVPAAPVPVVPPGASKEEAPEETAEVEAPVAVAGAIEAVAPEEPLLVVSDDSTESESPASQGPYSGTPEGDKSIETKEASQVETVQELTPVVAVESIPVVVEKQTPEELPAEENMPASTKDLAPIAIGDQVIVDPEENVPHESQSLEGESIVLVPSDLETKEAGQVEPAVEEVLSGLKEPAISVPIEVSQQEPDPEEQVDTEAKPEKPLEEDADTVEVAVLIVEKTEEVLGTSQEPIVVIPIQPETEEGAQVEPAAGETVPQEPFPENPVVIVPVETAEGELDLQEEEVVESIPIISQGASNQEAREENPEVEEPVAVESEVEAAAPETPVTVVGNEDAGVESAASEEPLPGTPQEESSILFSADLEKKEAGQAEPAVEETLSGPEEPAVIVPIDATQQEPHPEEVATEAKQEEAFEEHADRVEAAVLIVDNAEEGLAANQNPVSSVTDEEESIVLIPVKLETEEGAQVEPAAGETVPQEPVPEDPVVIVPVVLVQGELDKDAEVIVESSPVIFPEASKEEALAENPEVKESVHVESEVEAAAPETPVVVVGNEDADVESATSQEPPPGTPEGDVSVIPISADLETEEAGQVEPAAEETISGPEEPALDPNETTQQEPDPEEQVETETKPEEPQGEHADTTEAAVLIVDGTKEEPPSTSQEEETSIVIIPIPVEKHEGDQVEPAAEELEPQESIPEDSVVTVPEEPAERELDQEEQDVDESVSIVFTEEEESNSEETAVIPFESTEGPDQEDLILILPLDEDSTDDSVEAALEDDTVSLENEHDFIHTSVSEKLSETETLEKLVEVLTELLNEDPAESEAGLSQTVIHGEEEIVPAALEGVWATRVIPKGKRFGPFVGEKKKRSQVTSNVYMWEVYFPARGWMCVDATDPMKGNWLRYVNWARSSAEQNLFPLEINRAIYYIVLRPIGPGEELLVWYTVEDNPEITAALEEERASSLSRKNSPRAKRARRKLQEKAGLADLGEFKKSGNKPTVKEMWDGEGLKEEDVGSLTKAPSQKLQEANPTESTGCKDVQDMSSVMIDRRNGEEEEEEDANDLEDLNEAQQQTAQLSFVAVSMSTMHPGLSSEEQSHTESKVKFESSSPFGQEPEVDPELDLDPDPDGDLEGDPHGESFPCQHCERHFSTRQGLERHIHIHAINPQTQLFKCRYCSKSFGSQVGRRRHERRHESGPKKKPGSLAGTANLLSPMVQTDVSSPDCTSPTSHYVATGSQFTGGHLQISEVQRKDLVPHTDRPFILDENGESKELHPCKYCNKAFGTHTNMRRHQRRIHERHLLPKGVRRKGMLLQEASAQQQQQPDESPNTSPPPVYVPSADTEDEADRDDYAVDISKNISENLSFYIDGKIVSTSTVSSCEVIEVDSRSAALFGLDTVIINPNQISQALKVEGRMSAAKQVSNICQQTSKRRTSTPPLVPSLKVETETSSLNASSSSSTSSSSNLLVGGIFQQDPSTFQREKTVYLSPKLKQLLQTQDIQKSTITLITESHRLASPLSVTPLPGASGRFKRRTTSPPSSPQLSPAFKSESCKAEAASSYTLKVPKLENCSVSPTGSSLDKDEMDTLSPSGTNIHGHPSSGSGGNSCNQQPLDLSSTVCRRSDTSNKVVGDSALDLSLSRKSNVEPEMKGSPAPQQLIKKRKPNTSMLEKVLMNEYVGLSLAGDEGPSSLANLSCFHSRSPNVASESAHPSPPSLTPVTMNPSSPGTSSVTSPTPPPPVLPTIPSPPIIADSPLSQPSDSSTARPLPVLSPKMSPRLVEHVSDSEEMMVAEENKEEENHIPETLDPPSTLPKEPFYHSAPSSPEPPLVGLSATEDVSLTTTCNSLQNGEMNEDLNSVMEKSSNSDIAALSSQPETSSSTSPPPPALHDPPPSPLPPSPPQIKIKDEPLPCLDEQAIKNHAPPDDLNSAPDSAAPDKLSEVEEADSTYCKTFVCNVCEEPFNSMKELSGHITEHASDWPFKCEFCVQLFSDSSALLAHRTTLHGVGRIFLCSVCSKEFAFLCNLQQHQKDLHPNEACTHTSVESGKLRPQNYTDPSRAKEESTPSVAAPETSDEAVPHSDPDVGKEEPDVNGNHAEDGAEDPNEELYTTIKIMASEGGKPKGPDVRLGINQHYPSYKPPPFPYHSRSHAGSVASATNFTTHNIPQTFTTAIRCTKCGNSFDNMPELHQHILACANASDKKRYTPKKNPIPLKQIVKCPNGVISPSAAAAGQSAFRRMGQPKRLNFNQDAGKTKMSALKKKRNQLVQRAISHKNKAATTAKKASGKVEEQSNVCPHCSREFTYPASLSKHMAVSCPMKPAIKKGKKGLAGVKKEADKNMNLRRKASDCELPQTEPEHKPLGKTRARSSGAADPEPSLTSRGKMAATLGPLKRPASFPASVPVSKKSKKGQAQSLPPTPSAPDSSDSAQKPTMRMQRMGKEAPPKRLMEAKSPPQQQKKEERFSLRTRERVGGPVTRSLQMANIPPSAEVKTEGPQIPEPKETQEVLMK